MEPPLQVTWTARPEPLQAAAVVATGNVVRALAADTLLRLERGVTVHTLRATGWLLVLADPDDLPWADGAVYLGRDAGLLVPTTQEPHPGADFLAAALDPAPLRVVLPGQLLTATLPSRPPDPAGLMAVR